MKKSKFFETLSFSGGIFLTEFLSSVFGGYVFFYYSDEIGLDGWLILLVYVIYSVWGAFTSPLIGNITNRKNRFTKKWGNHFPWLILSAIPWFLCFFFLFYFPFEISVANHLKIFAWFLIFICCYKVFFGIFGMNYSTSFPNKFRKEDERRTASTIMGVLAYLATGIGGFLPAFIIGEWNNPYGFIVMAGWSLLVCVIIFFLSIPGLREKSKERGENDDITDKKKQLSLYQSFKLTIKQKNFMILTVCLFLNLVMVQSIGTALPFVIKYIFFESPQILGVISIITLVGSVTGVFVWKKIHDKLTDNKKVFQIGTGLVAIILILFFFLNNDISLYIVGFLYSFCYAGFWTTLTIPLSAEVFDEIAATTGERNENIYSGVRGFFMSFSFAVSFFIVIIIQKLTGFNENLTVQSDLAIIGLRINISIIPLICIISTFILIKKFYTITPERLKEYKLKIEELGI